LACADDEFDYLVLLDGFARHTRMVVVSSSGKGMFSRLRGVKVHQIGIYRWKDFPRKCEVLIDRFLSRLSLTATALFTYGVFHPLS